jgi:hypothetical protein
VAADVYERIGLLLEQLEVACDDWFERNGIDPVAAVAQARLDMPAVPEPTPWYPIAVKVSQAMERRHLTRHLAAATDSSAKGAGIAATRARLAGLIDYIDDLPPTITSTARFR